MMVTGAAVREPDGNRSIAGAPDTGRDLCNRNFVANEQSMSTRRRKRSRSLSEFYTMATESDGMRRILLVLLVIALACAIVFAGVSIEQEFAMDSCMDMGGRWNTEAASCER